MTQNIAIVIMGSVPIAKCIYHGWDVFTFRVREPGVHGLAPVSAIVRISRQTSLPCADHPDKVAGNARIKLCHSTLYGESGALGLY